MCKSHFNILAFKMNNWIKRIPIHVVLQQILQSIFRLVLISVVVHCQSSVEVAIVPQQLLHVLRTELEVEEDGIVGNEHHRCTVLRIALGHLVVFGDVTLIELRNFAFAVAHAFHFEVAAERVHRFGTDTIQTHALFERT